MPKSKSSTTVKLTDLDRLTVLADVERTVRLPLYIIDQIETLSTNRGVPVVRIVDMLVDWARILVVPHIDMEWREMVSRFKQKTVQGDYAGKNAQKAPISTIQHMRLTVLAGALNVHPENFLIEAWQAGGRVFLKHLPKAEAAFQDCVTTRRAIHAQRSAFSKRRKMLDRQADGMRQKRAEEEAA